MIESQKNDSWKPALNVYENYIKSPCKLEKLFIDVPDECYSGVRRLITAGIKNKSILNHTISLITNKLPKRQLFTFTFIALADLREAFFCKADKIPKITHSWVERAKAKFSKRERQYINAILRKAIEVWEQKFPLDLEYSHPKWLIERWQKQFEEENTINLLKFNQSIAPIYIRSNCELLSNNSCFKPTKWNNFFELKSSEGWPLVRRLLNDNLAYVQDPFTLAPVQLLDVQPDDKVLDLCAAPGGKSLQIAELLSKNGILVAVDLPGKEEKLTNNLSKFTNTKILFEDLTNFLPSKMEENLPKEFDKVLVDVPCSNTGVIRRKPDIKWRLKSRDIKKLAKLQLKLLCQAAKFVKHGGFLVYSTCSVDKDENENVVKDFLNSHNDFKLLKKKISYPWIENHDGGAAFLLKKAAGV